MLPTVPVTLIGLVMIGATEAGAITMVRTAVLVPAEFVAVSVTNVVPACVGVPLIAPVRGFRARPGGRLKVV